MKNYFDITGKVVVLTGACGILGRNIAGYLVENGAKVVLLARKDDQGKALEAELKQKGDALYLKTDVMNKEMLEQNREDILKAYGTIDVLLNAAGGNMSGATIAPDKSFLDLSVDAFRQVVDLNLFGTILPTQVFLPVMAEKKKGVIVNFCSESALRPLTRVVGYGSAKAAIANYTRYMATELATKFSPEIRMNAIVPGFLLTNQNRALLTNPDGSLTARGQSIIAHTPMGRFAEPEELFGTIHYLISDASSFVTGALSIVDGGFDAFSI
ncbi:MAG: SDR family oxidoreductase [Bacteroidaceae bacterium]|nr:SDR family oxidoreductase [Bacteroidaceae bacterium]